jgi:uncharacterized protein HemX
MRERAVSTSIIWIALAFSIDRIVDNIGGPESTFVQIGLMALVFVLIIGASVATSVIWQSAAQKTEQRAQEEAEKAKRDNRDARLKRLLKTLDDDELDALEQERLGDDGERLSLEALMRKRS